MRILSGMIVALAAWIAVALVAWAFGQPAAQPKEVREYHPIAIAVLAADDPGNWKHIRGSHLEVSGWVTYQVKEGDGDTHIRLCDSPSVKEMDTAHCIVAECIPLLPCKLPKVGQKVTVRGIVRYDAEHPGHHWWEVHPVEELEVHP